MMVDSSEESRVSRAQTLLGHEFADPELVRVALTHPSYTDGTTSKDYERLEFLGDAVLSLVVVEEVFRTFPELPEGVLTKMKIALVSGSVLAEVASELGLAEMLYFGESERASGTRGLASAMEDALEALIGALYLDAGLEDTREFVLRVLGDRITPEAAESLDHPKSRLQEIVQARGVTPEYVITAEEGPPHDRVFTAILKIGGVIVGEGSGHSKKEAEMNAAQHALDDMGRE